MDGDQIIAIIFHKGILKDKTSKDVAQVLWLSDMMGSIRSLDQWNCLVGSKPENMEGKYKSLHGP
jgi:hypothetical protein